MNVVYTSTVGGAYDTLLPPNLNNKTNIITLGVANENKIPIGVIAAQVNDYSYEIIWLYVREEERRKGVASGLIREFLSVIRNTNQIYPVSLLFDSSSEDIYEFMYSLDFFSCSCIGRRYFIDSDRRRNSDMVVTLMEQSRRKHNFEKIQLFFEQSDLCRNNVYRKLMALGIDLSRLIYESRNTFINDLCLCHVETGYYGQKIDSFILVKELSEQEFDILFAYAENKVGFAQVLIEVLSHIEEKYPSVSLSITALNNHSDKLARHLFGADISCERLLVGKWNYLLDSE